MGRLVDQINHLLVVLLTELVVERVDVSDELIQVWQLIRLDHILVKEPDSVKALKYS
jgi:hypothetical protein